MKPSPRLAGAGDVVARVQTSSSSRRARADIAASTPRSLADDLPDPAHPAGGVVAQHVPPPPTSRRSVADTSEASSVRIQSARLPPRPLRAAGSRRPTDKWGDAGSIAGLFQHPGQEGTSEKKGATDDKRLLRATRRAKSGKLMWAPEDEQAVLSARRHAQEDEWRRLLAKGAIRATAGPSEAGRSQATDSAAGQSTATTASVVPAGFGAQDYLTQASRNGCIIHKGLVVAFFDEHLGDAEPTEPLLPGLRSKDYTARQTKAPSVVASQTSTTVRDVLESRPDGGMVRLSWLTKLGSRP
eukprot:TRINITY_DN49769_c0_g1_i1.p1 TRINITY_DN49769_c0_g1~~TRINITY_DN49769_c0_g1_i1.p1  ORF type:complete len:299 (-),score=54.01 TRINITY_DN49769_c0_g1_i1:148-1044(-)